MLQDLSASQVFFGFGGQGLGLKGLRVTRFRFKGTLNPKP